MLSESDSWFVTLWTHLKKMKNDQQGCWPEWKLEHNNSEVQHTPKSWGISGRGDCWCGVWRSTHMCRDLHRIYIHVGKKGVSYRTWWDWRCPQTKSSPRSQLQGCRECECKAKSCGLCHQSWRNFYLGPWKVWKVTSPKYNVVGVIPWLWRQVAMCPHGGMPRMVDLVIVM
jgi:hypothetical protein